MERTDTGEQSFFRFDGDGRYTIPLTHGDDEVKRGGGGGPPPGLQESRNVSMRMRHFG